VKIEDVRRAARPADEARRPWASVLCLLGATEEGPGLVLERRPAGGFFGGHLSFPGGKVEEDDADGLAAALRETEEEIGVASRDVEVLGLLAEATDPRGHAVACFAAALRGDLPDRPASPREVEETLLVPASSLLRPGSIPPRRGLYVATAYEGRLWPPEEKLVQYWSLEGAEARAMLWGFTAGLVSVLLHDAVGWQPPAAPRIVDRWQDLLPEPAVPP